VRECPEHGPALRFHRREGDHDEYDYGTCHVCGRTFRCERFIPTPGRCLVHYDAREAEDTAYYWWHGAKDHRGHWLLYDLRDRCKAVSAPEELCRIVVGEERERQTAGIEYFDRL
jgi:hypothetical protein